MKATRLKAISCERQLFDDKRNTSSIFVFKIEQCHEHIAVLMQHGAASVSIPLSYYFHANAFHNFLISFVYLSIPPSLSLSDSPTHAHTYNPPPHTLI